jgi:hypothetical protein
LRTGGRRRKYLCEVHGLSEFANPKDIQVGFSSLKREKNAVWFFGEEMWDLILG